LIVKADGVAINTSEKLNEIRDKKVPGDTIVLTVIRNGELKDITVTLSEDIPENK
jgi:S1-C subfamily serine protease